jgi:Zn-finger nucleic acid-binding protein
MSIYRQGPSPAGACPRCRESLLGIAGVPSVRRCEKCGGVFADLDASRRIVSVFDRTLAEVGFLTSLGKPPAEDTGRTLSCPECLITMQRVRVESAACFIDACPAHGSWFDPGELQPVMRAYQRAREASGRTFVPRAAVPDRAPTDPGEPPSQGVLDAVLDALRPPE